MPKLNLDRPRLMGILNLTPDSFSDGGKFLDPNQALDRVQQLIDDGADIIDIGAESTFGAEALVTAEEEWKRLEPVIISVTPTEAEESLTRGAVRDPSTPLRCGRDDKKTTISIDTHKSSVAARALDLGVDMINDVTALRGDPDMIDVLLKYQPYVCLMYSAYETPYAGRENKQYDDVIATIKMFLTKQTNLLISRGFPPEKIIIDPGLGFFLSTDPKYSWEVIDRLGELKTLGFPILVGPSMKSFLGGEIKDRLPPTLEVAKKCLANGANILRVHDVVGHKKILKNS